MMKALLRAVAVVTAFGAVLSASAAEKIHELRPTATTVHRGYFDASIKPALTIDSGDIVRIWTASGNPKYYEDLGVPKDKIPPELYTAYEGEKSDQRLDQTLTGPIFVRGAQIGDTIEVRLRQIELWLPLAAMSFRAGRGSLPEEFPYSRDRVMWLDVAKKTLDFAPEPRRRRRWAASTRACRVFTAATWTTRISSRAPASSCRCTRRAGCCRSATATRHRATAK
jgi:hypothetical protein